MKKFRFLLNILGSATLIIAFVLLRNKKIESDKPFAGISGYFKKSDNGIDPDTLVFVCPDKKSDEPQVDKPADKAKRPISDDQHNHSDLWYESRILAGMEKRGNRKRERYII